MLIHNLGGSVDIWRYQVAALTDTYGVLTFDLRGQGASSNPGVAYSVADLADDSVRLMDSLGIGRALPGGSGH